jgi:hypothetical protein
MRENMDDWCEQQDFVEGAQDQGNKGPPAQNTNRSEIILTQKIFCRKQP